MNLRVKFVTWNFHTELDFGLKVRSSTRLNAIVDKIKDKYGGSIIGIMSEPRGARLRTSLTLCVFPQT